MSRSTSYPCTVHLESITLPHQKMGKHQPQYSDYPHSGVDRYAYFVDNAQYYQPQQQGPYGAQYGAPQYGHYAPQ